MAPLYFQPHQHPQLVALMAHLERMQFDLLDAHRMAITVHDKARDDQPSVIARSASALTPPLPSVGCRGPVPDALLTRCRC